MNCDYVREMRVRAGDACGKLGKTKDTTRKVLLGMGSVTLVEGNTVRALEFKSKGLWNYCGMFVGYSHDSKHLIGSKIKCLLAECSVESLDGFSSFPKKILSIAITK